MPASSENYETFKYYLRTEQTHRSVFTHDHEYNNKLLEERYKMAEKVAKVGVKKTSGYLYFVDKKGNVARAKMSRGRW